MTAKYLELHILQSFVPSNLNRDDNNSPKTAEFGGARRARISSQCLKHAIRQSEVFHQTIQADIGTRTKWLAGVLAAEFERQGRPADEARDVALGFARKYTKMDDKKKDQTAVLIFFSRTELREFAKAILANWDAVLSEVRKPEDETEGGEPKPKKGKGKSKSDDESGLGQIVNKLLKDKEYKDLRERTDAPDIALFGRMLADHPETNIAAACQVANAFSTHEVETEYDYFTAMDDEQPKGVMGASMIQLTGFNSACYYRYALVDWNLLNENLNGDASLAQRAVEGFLRAAVEVTPSGMKNRFAQNCQPDFVLAVVRDGGPGWSLANAFEKPVKPKNDSGYIAPSVRALDAYWQRLHNAYEGEGVQAVRFFNLSPETDEAAPNLSAQPENHTASLKQWRESILKELASSKETAA